MRKGIFYIDASEIRAEGYTNGRTWNGWQCPWFTMEQALLIAEQCRRDEFCENLMVFDAENDCFIDYEYGEVDEEDAWRYVGKDIDGLHVYPIGDGWIWSEEREA